jgi:hypothetical protein
VIIRTGHKSPLRIITGIGQHSINNNPKILPAVENYLNKGGWDWRFENGLRINGVLVVRGLRQKR